jgi:tRNA U34 2-thiouridine synthase MnmA/TrmU
MRSIHKLYTQSIYTETQTNDAYSSRSARQTVYIVDSGSNETSAPISKQNISFLSTLADQLQDLTEAVEARIDYIKQTAVPKPKDNNNHILASIDTPNMNLTVGAEFILYVQKFGPPPLGKFDPEKLAEVRAEYGIGKE